MTPFNQHMGWGFILYARTVFTVLRPLEPCMCRAGNPQEVDWARENPRASCPILVLEIDNHETLDR